MSINTSTNKFRVITTTVSGLTSDSKFSDIKTPALVVNTSEGGVFYTDGSKSTLTQVAALPNHSHSYLPLSGGTITSTANSPLKINTSYNANSVANSWIGAINCFNTSLSANQHFTIDIGKSASTKNEGWLGFYYVADGSNNNRLSLGLHSMDDVINIFGSGNVSIGNAQNTAADEKLHVHGNVKATKFIGDVSGNATSADKAICVVDYGNANSNIYIGYSGTGLTSNTCSHLAGYTENGTKLKDISAYEVKRWLSLGSAAYTASGDYAPATHTHDQYLACGRVAFTPAETALTSEEVLSKTGGWSLRKGTWDYAGNGYITSSFGNIDLAGTSILTFGDSNTYTQLFITAPAQSGHNGITNEMIFYNNHGSSYAPAWTRVLTNWNYQHYCLPTTGATHSGAFTIKSGGDLILKAPSYATSDPGDLAFYNNSGSELARIYYGSSKMLMRYGSSAASYEILTTNTGAAKSHSHEYSFLETNGSSVDVGFQCNGSQYSIAFMIGSGNVNRGIYDRTANAWWMYRASTSTTNFAGQISCDSSITAKNFITSSDRRLKKNINEISSDKLSNVLNVNFYEFDYVNNDNHSAGHIAQEVKEILPEFVHKDESDDEMLAIDYTGLHSIQIKALIDRIEKLEEEIKQLKSSNIRFK